MRAKSGGQPDIGSGAQYRGQCNRCNKFRSFVKTSKCTKCDRFACYGCYKSRLFVKAFESMQTTTRESFVAGFHLIRPGLARGVARRISAPSLRGVAFYSGFPGGCDTRCLSAIKLSESRGRCTMQIESRRTTRLTMPTVSSAPSRPSCIVRDVAVLGPHSRNKRSYSLTAREDVARLLAKQSRLVFIGHTAPGEEKSRDPREAIGEIGCGRLDGETVRGTFRVFLDSDVGRSVREMIETTPEALAFSPVSYPSWPVASPNHAIVERIRDVASVDLILSRDAGTNANIFESLPQPTEENTAMTTLLPPRRILKSVRLHEDVRVGRPKVDRQAGVIRGVRVLGRQSKNDGGMREYSDRALSDAAQLYKNASVNLNHPPRENPTGERDVRDRIGWIADPEVRDDGVYADLHVLRAHPHAAALFEIAERNPSQLGLSHNAEGKTERQNDGRNVVQNLEKVRSIDLVDKPATNSGLFENEDDTMTEDNDTSIDALLQKVRDAGVLTDDELDQLEAKLRGSEAGEGAVDGIVGGNSAPSPADDPDRVAIRQAMTGGPSVGGTRSRGLSGRSDMNAQPSGSPGPDLVGSGSLVGGNGPRRRMAVAASGSPQSWKESIRECLFAPAHTEYRGSARELVHQGSLREGLLESDSGATVASATASKIPTGEAFKADLMRGAGRRY